MAKKGKRKPPSPQASPPEAPRPEGERGGGEGSQPADRRCFLKLVGVGALAAGAAGLWITRRRWRNHDGDEPRDAGPDGGRMEPVPRPPTLVTFNEHQYDTLDALAGILLPGDDQDPGARETGAMVYIDRAFDQVPAFAVGARSMKVAVSALDWQSQQAYAKNFVELSVPEQELVVQAVYQGEADKNRFKGRTFLTLMMSMVLEGHLSEPVYGGNKDEMGWKLVGFDPLDPRPPHGSGGHHDH